MDQELKNQYLLTSVQYHYHTEVYRIRISGLDSGRIQHILNKQDRIRTRDDHGARVPSGLRPEFAFWAGAGAGVGVNVLGSSRSRSRIRSKVCLEPIKNFKGPNF